MSEQRNDRSITVGDVFVLVLITFTLLLITSMTDSCTARSRYLDLRERLERLEQRK